MRQFGECGGGLRRPGVHGRSPRDTRNDRHGVSRLHRRVTMRQLPVAAIVHVHVHEAAQAAILRNQVPFEPRVLAREPLQQLADVSAFQLERVAAADVGAQRRGNQYRDCHTAFRSSMVMDSSANVPRSSARTQLFRSPARPAPTPTMTYESHGHAWSRSNADGTGGWSGCEWYTPITSSPSRSRRSCARRNDAGSIRERLRTESGRWLVSGTR